MKVPKIEGLIIFAFFICVALWAVSKCTARRTQIGKKLQEMSDDREDRPVRRDTVFVPQPAAPQPQPDLTAPAPRPVPAGPPPATPQRTAPQTTSPETNAPIAKTPVAKTPTAKTPANTPATPKYSTLYVTIDGLNLRKTPGVKAETIEQLELYQAVLFLNQKSEKPEEINLGTEKVTDHWVKVRTQSGKEGWVFGAGVHYYKTKRKE